MEFNYEYLKYNVREDNIIKQFEDKMDGLFINIGSTEHYKRCLSLTNGNSDHYYTYELTSIICSDISPDDCAKLISRISFTFSYKYNVRNGISFKALIEIPNELIGIEEKGVEDVLKDNGFKLTGCDSISSTFIKTNPISDKLVNENIDDYITKITNLSDKIMEMLELNLGRLDT